MPKKSTQKSGSPKSENRKQNGNDAQQSQSTDAADQFETRMQKLKTMLGEGKNPYSNSYDRTHTTKELAGKNPEDFQETERFKIAGRIRSKRLMGKAAFLDLHDETGRLQLYARKEEGVDFALVKSLDLGDIAGVEGYLFQTKVGETTLHVTGIQLLAKCLRPLPVVKEADGVTYDAFADKEQRYRMRYVDLVVNPRVREVFETRSRIIAFIRNYLIQKGYLEVETPMMHPIPGGAAARPFVTHHNTLDMELFLRIAPELYLKRLLVGGFTKVFEINRNFRNEGISIKHNPEFTMLEVYEAYGNMQSMLELCESMLSALTLEICGSTQIPYGEHLIEMKAPWEKITYCDAIEKYAGVKIESGMKLSDAVSAAKQAGIPEAKLKDCSSVWKVAEVLFDEKVEAELIQPVCITRFPKELSPLAKASQDDPEFTDRFEPYIVGREMGNAFSELNDPVDQQKRFELQVKAREAGDEEGGYMDKDYIRALQYGMPPAGGMGIGIDRLVMLLTNSASIRDTILFPLLRPEKD